MTEFVEGWTLAQTLGEGAYGEVKLVINKVTGESVAMKMIDLLKHPTAKQSVQKETTVHRMLSNPNVIHYFGHRSEPNMEYIFLEYASGGELFDRIEPDVGMPIKNAQKYFRQLISAVEYLHSRGVAHRDLKPENLLLDKNDNLKVSDFGLATVFRVRGLERQLNTRCGTMPYVAPEVLLGNYHAQPADLWSCGVILVALLAGELPWDQASTEFFEFREWLDGEYMCLTPWSKLDYLSVAYIRKILVFTPSARYKIKDIESHPWFVKNLDDSYSDRVDGAKLKKLHKISDESDQGVISYSQPVMTNAETDYNMMRPDEKQQNMCFSQPTIAEDLLLCSQLQALSTQSAQSPMQNLVKRMTRFFVMEDHDIIVKRIINHAEHENYSYKITEYRTITISTVDRRKMPLVFKANILDMDDKILVDFRLSKGCGIEFKRRFIKFKLAMEDIIIKGLTATWLAEQ